MTIRLLALSALLTVGCGGQQHPENASSQAGSALGATTAPPSSAPQAVAATEGHVPVSIRLAGELNAELRAELEALGMRWQRGDDGELVHIGPIYSGSAPAENTPAMQALDGVVRVEQSGRAPLEIPDARLLSWPTWECDPARAMPPPPSCPASPVLPLATNANTTTPLHSQMNTRLNVELNTPTPPQPATGGGNH